PPRRWPICETPGPGLHAELVISRRRLTRLGCQIPLAHTVGHTGRISPPHQPIHRNRTHGSPVSASEAPQADTAGDRRRESHLRTIVEWAAQSRPPPLIA